MGAFHAFVGEPDVELVGVEAAGEGLERAPRGPAGCRRPGVLHGALSYLLQDVAGQVAEAHSISAGLDYPGVGPEHSYLKDAGLARYESVTDAQALAAFRGWRGWRASSPRWKARTPWRGCWRTAGRWDRAGPVVICLSGRGDKDVAEVAELDSPDGA
jgi:tryptophan synthase beta chain